MYFDIKFYLLTSGKHCLYQLAVNGIEPRTVIAIIL